mmetsp:Transcript_32883/g.76806  ORF Transcript_32883/g.76806 Transcript_32883/m.76806 type:complete len:302 (-) Transcript_32883:858-1763(-)
MKVGSCTSMGARYMGSVAPGQVWAGPIGTSMSMGRMMGIIILSSAEILTRRVCCILTGLCTLIWITMGVHSVRPPDWVTLSIRSLAPAFHMALNLLASVPASTSFWLAAVRLPPWMPMCQGPPCMRASKSILTIECMGMGTLAWNVTVMVLRQPGYEVDWLMFLMVNSAEDGAPAPALQGPPLTLRGSESLTPHTSTGLLMTSTSLKQRAPRGPRAVPVGLSPMRIRTMGEGFSQPLFLTTKLIVWLTVAVRVVKLKESSPEALSHVTPFCAEPSRLTTGAMSVCVPCRPVRVILFSGSVR